MAFAEAFVTGLAWYAAAGVAFAIAFLAVGVARVDSQARGAGLGFRLIVFPGIAALWPVLLVRWVRGGEPH